MGDEELTSMMEHAGLGEVARYAAEATRSGRIQWQRLDNGQRWSVPVAEDSSLWLCLTERHVTLNDSRGTIIAWAQGTLPEAQDLRLAIADQRRHVDVAVDAATAYLQRIVA